MLLPKSQRERAEETAPYHKSLGALFDARPNPFKPMQINAASVRSAIRLSRECVRCSRHKRAAFLPCDHSLDQGDKHG